MLHCSRMPRLSAQAAAVYSQLRGRSPAGARGCGTASRLVALAWPTTLDIAAPDRYRFTALAGEGGEIGSHNDLSGDATVLGRFLVVGFRHRRPDLLLPWCTAPAMTDDVVSRFVAAAQTARTSASRLMA